MKNDKQTDKPVSLLASLRELRQLLNRREKIGFVILLVMMIIGAGLETFSVGMIPAFVSTAVTPETILKNEHLQSLLALLGISTPRQLLVAGCIGLIVVFLVKNVFKVFQLYFQVRYTENRALHLRYRLFRAYMDAPYEFHLNRNTAELVRNTQVEVDKIIYNVFSPLLSLVMNLFIVAGMVLLLFLSQPLMALLALTVIGVAGIGYEGGLKRRLEHYGQEALGLRRSMFKIIQEGLGGIKEVRVLRRENSFVQQFLERTQRNVRLIRFRTVAAMATTPFMETVAVMTLLLVAIILVTTGSKMEAIAPTLALFAGALVRIRGSFTAVVGGVAGLRFGAASVHPVYSDLKELQRLEQKPRNGTSGESESDVMAIQHELRLTDVGYHYEGSSAFSLSNIELVIPRGGSIAFVGSTGAGKTTIVDVVLGLLEPQRGTITVDGKSVYGNLPAWQKSIGYIPQVIYLTDDTIRRNVALGLDEGQIDDEQVRKVLRVAQLDAFIQTLPEGVETVVGERGVRLSGGQRQRIGIARALYHNPDVLVMDEATSNLDSATERGIVESVNALKGERTVIMIAHRLSTVKDCDRLYFMKDGQIMASGTYEELLAEHEEFKQMASA